MGVSTQSVTMHLYRRTGMVFRQRLVVARGGSYHLSSAQFPSYRYLEESFSSCKAS